MTAVRMVHVLSESWTLTPPDDLPGLVAMAVEAEAAGFDAVMLSEHVVLGASAGSNGPMANPREYALPGNQDPATPWPSSLLLLAAIATVTTRLRLFACAVIPPLRHPLTIANDLATLDLLSRGRLVVLPTVSWHTEEYAALGVPFAERGERLDEHLAAWRAVWSGSPASFHGRHYAFDDVWLEPKPHRPGGPVLHFGAASMHPALVRRLVTYGSGFNPLGIPPSNEMDVLRAAMHDAGRDLSELELVGGTRAEFPDASSPAPLAPALARIPAQQAMGFTTFCIKPAQFLDDRTRHAAFCREVIERVSDLPEPPAR